MALGVIHHALDAVALGHQAAHGGVGQQLAGVVVQVVERREELLWPERLRAVLVHVGHALRDRFEVLE